MNLRKLWCKLPRCYFFKVRLPKEVSTRKTRLIRWLVGKPKPHPTGQERISTLWDALKWRAADFLPGWDASLSGTEDDEHVMLFWTMTWLKNIGLYLVNCGKKNANNSF